MKPRACCEQTIARWCEAVREAAETTKRRGGVALFCPGCKSRVVYTGGEWQREESA